MAREETKADLIVLVRAAVISADRLGEPDAATRLDGALVALTGKGLEPHGWTISTGLDQSDFKA